ncbi:MAG: cytochrome b5 domain-containing protein [Deltaproteobacteria bacterium]|nr:cytochrome b5 domain-containing protein [Deltaproteobacteria bacterium]
MGLGRFIARLFGKKEAPRAPLPEAEERDYSLSELASYDGLDPAKPLLIGIRGQVYDVTRGRDFYGPGGPYGMFAGKDCTRALAKVSFDEEAKVSFDEELFTGDIAGLEPHELDKLEEWIEMFEGKYRRIGRLLEP